MVDDVVAGARIAERVALLLESDRWSAERRRSWRHEALDSLLASADRSPFWAERIRAAGSFAALPPLDRATLRDRLPHLRTAVDRPVLTWRTSGSTGRPVTVEQGADSLGFETAARRRQLAWNGLAPTVLPEVGVANRAPASDPPVRRTRECPPTFAVNPWRLDAQAADAIHDVLATAEVCVIEGVPSQVADWAAAAVRGEHDPRALGARLAIVGGEMVFAAQRALIQRAFGCPVRELYGAMEARALASECAAGSLHVNEELALVEIVRDDGSTAAPGERGEVVVTPLHNHEFPLLRYRLGDLAAFATGGPCACGSTLARLDGLVGRREEHAMLRSGARIHPRFLRTIYEAEFGERLLAFHTVQDEPGRFTAHVALSGALDPGAARRIERAVADHLGEPAAVRLVSAAGADACVRFAGGKLRTFTCAAGDGG